jgi:hypothetical protein
MIFDRSICELLAQSMFHFLWQGGLIGLGFYGLGTALRLKPRHRYPIGLLCMFGLLLCMPITFAWLYEQRNSPFTAMDIEVPETTTPTMSSQENLVLTNVPESEQDQQSATLVAIQQSANSPNGKVESSSSR